jgi:hypothetical protein
VDVCTWVNEVQLTEGTTYNITWKFTASGSYTAVEAYKDQFEGMINFHLPEAVWKNGLHQNANFFAWLILINRVWTTDRFQKLGWPNCGVSQLCKREPESVDHLLFKCRYSTMICKSIIAWLGISNGALVGKAL